MRQDEWGETILALSRCQIESNEAMKAMFSDLQPKRAIAKTASTRES